MLRTRLVRGIVVASFVLAGAGYALLHKPVVTTKPISNTRANNVIFTTKNDPTLGQYLADPVGSALYIYSKDTLNVSNCLDTCLANWPAYQDQGSTVNLPQNVGVIKRSDNSAVQYTYMGMPLYYFVGDGSKQASGDGVNEFHIAKPTTAPDTSASPDNSLPSSNNSSSSYPY